MKKFLFLLISLILVVSCSNNIGNSNGNLDKYSVKNSISNSTVDLKDAKYLAITLSESTTGAKGIGNKRPHLHKVRENGESEEVVIQEDYSDYEVSVDSLDLEIYKMTTIENYSIVSYISSRIRDELEAVPITYSLGEQKFTLYVYPGFQDLIQWPWNSKLDRTNFQIYDITRGVPIDFNTKGYFNNDYIKSYLINNKTGKIYSLEQFEFLNVENGILCDDKKTYYDVAFDKDDNLILTEIISNKDITINNVFIDKDNWRYIVNDFIDDIDSDKKIRYLLGGNYYYDSTNTLVKLNYLDPEKNHTLVPKIKYENGVPFEITKDDTLIGLIPLNRYDDNKAFEKTALINGRLANNTQSVGGNGVISGKVLATDIFTGYSCYVENNDSSRKNTFWYDDSCEYLCSYQNGSSLEYTKVDWANAEYCGLYDLTEDKLFKTEWTTLLDNVIKTNYYMMNGIQIEKVNYVFKCIGLNGTDYYQLKENDTHTGLEVELLTQVVTPTKYYVIQPIK